MNKTPFPRPEEFAPALLALARTLRDLYRTARSIRHSAPYAAARLARIADQAEYFLQQWPAGHWPDTSPAGQPMPPKDALLAQIAAASTEARRYASPAGRLWPYASWQQVSALMLEALEPFA